MSLFRFVYQSECWGVSITASTPAVTAPSSMYGRHSVSSTAYCLFAVCVETRLQMGCTVMLKWRGKAHQVRGSMSMRLLPFPCCADVQIIQFTRDSSGGRVRIDSEGRPVVTYWPCETTCKHLMEVSTPFTCQCVALCIQTDAAALSSSLNISCHPTTLSMSWIRRCWDCYVSQWQS